MKKKDYMKPVQRTVRIEHQHIICTSDPVRNIDSGDTGIGYGGGGSSPNRARQHSAWDDDWDYMWDE